MTKYEPWRGREADRLTEAIETGDLSIQVVDAAGTLKRVAELTPGDLRFYAGFRRSRAVRNQQLIDYLEACANAVSLYGVDVAEDLPADVQASLSGLEAEIIAGIRELGPLPGVAMSDDGHLMFPVPKKGQE